MGILYNVVYFLNNKQKMQDDIVAIVIDIALGPCFKTPRLLPQHFWQCKTNNPILDVK